MLYLSRQTLESLDVSTAEVVARLEGLIRDQAEGKVMAAPKSAVTAADGRYLMATLAAAEDPPLMAVKSLVVNPKNPQHDLAAINASITLLNSQTGLTVAVMDGNWVTAIRTAAATAVAAKRLANANSSVVCFIGCGVQAHSHLRILADLFPLEEIRAFGRGAKNQDSLCRSATAMGLRALAGLNAGDAVAGADIVVSSIPVTARVAPFLDANWLKPGAFVSSTDLALPWMDDSMRAFDRIVIDDIKQESAMPSPMVAADLVKGDITGLVSGRISGRAAEHERTAFVFRAVVLGDLALAGLAYEKALAAGKGMAIDE